jgi:WhiB family redox-sensing transcriptional regulator
VTVSPAERKRRWRQRKRREDGPPPARTAAEAVATLDLSWRARGACSGLDPELFYPERGDVDGLAAARDVCRRCPVREPCVDLGIAELPGRVGGVYGGLSNRQLKALRRFRVARARLEEDRQAATEAAAS